MPLRSGQAKPRKGELVPSRLLEHGADRANATPFGELLRRHRRAAGISQDFLAERARLSPAAVSALERGRRRAPYRATVTLLADALGLSEEQRAELELAAEYGRARGVSPGPAHEANIEPAAAERITNLPVQLTSFIGRDAELAELSALLKTHRLVTVTGSGGIGKTRTSLQFAEQLLDDFADGVWFIELAPLADGCYLPSSVAQVLGLALAQAGDPLANLVRAIARKHALLVFDNCEHLIEPAARVLVAILQGCPNVKGLATSRHVLGVNGEATYRMPSLAVPESSSITAADARQYAAMSLFVERARDADNRFALTDGNASVVADICRRLDGIPLALELASSRVKMLTPRQLRERLDERFRMLTGGSRDALPRQQTLRALIDWSHDLLDERERVLFRRLGVFVNGFVFEGAAAVASGEDLDEVDVFDLLASLVDKSLVLAEPYGDSLRHRFLESTRAYASEKLADAGERYLVAGRHLRYLRDRFTQLFERSERTARRADLVSALRTDLEEIRSALEGALTRSEVIDGAALLVNIHMSWQVIGLDTEGMAWCERYLAVLPADELELRARLLTELSMLLSGSGRPVRALKLATEGVEHARASGDGSSLGWALCIFVSAATTLNRLDEAERAIAQAEAIPGTSASHQFNMLATRAYFSQARGDRETAASLYEQLCKASRALENVRSEFMAMLNLAEVEHERGQTQRAIALVREMLLTLRSADYRNMWVSLHQNLAGYLVAVDDLPGAMESAREAIEILAALEPDHPFVAVPIEHLALIVALCGDPVRAAILEGYAEAGFQRHGMLRQATEARTHGRLCALLRERLPPNERARLMAKGAALTAEAAIALALEEDEAPR